MEVRKKRGHGITVLLLFSLCLTSSRNRVLALDIGKCHRPLGMENGNIPDEALTASSSHDNVSVGPKSARIRHDIAGGAWCPRGLIDKKSYEFLQIDLGGLKVVTRVEVQGRFGGGAGQEYAEFFLLEYQREDGGEWIRFRNRTEKEKFVGNDNARDHVLRDVQPPIIGKRLRFIPFSKNRRQVCMRVEMYGCDWQDGTVWYAMRQGDSRGSEINLSDFTYDGMIDKNHLLDGLGQLMDGEVGLNNFRLDYTGSGVKGYEWVGWRNDSVDNTGPVEIKFKFETPRNFSSVIINCNNFFTKDVRVFKMALVYFSMGGKYFLQEPIRFEFLQDKVMGFNHRVVINLRHTIGRYVKLKLFFDSKWMLISEIQFESVPAEGNFTEEEPPPTTVPLVMTSDGTMNDEAIVVVAEPDSSADSKPVSDVRGEEATQNEDVISIIIGALAALIVILSIVVIFVFVRYRRRQNQNRQTLKPVSDNHLTINLNNFHGNMNGKVSNGNVYNGVATEEEERATKNVVSIKGMTVEYAEPDDTNSPLIVALPPVTPVTPGSQKALQGKHGSFASSIDKPPNYDALYAAADIVTSQVPNIPSLQGVSGNNVYAVPNSDLLVSSVDMALVEFPRRNLRFVEVLGEGEFGEVHLCEAVGISEYMAEEYMVNRRASCPTLVAVKILRKDADDRARSDFHREMKVMSMLKDPNIVRVLGVCTREQPLCMIVEYMKFGDLNQFLMDHVPETNMAAPAAKRISYGCQIYMASQIASGMKYLESLNMVHRDLATRNCLVGAYCTIKISDFGMSRSLYSADYYRIEGRAVLPIRWMAWESILLGKFTCKSDVWSFGVTLWEVLTFAREQPFEGLSDDQVIENAGHYYRNDNEQVYLSHPPICPKEIYDLMFECWNRQESERPSFREIHMFLQRKNMGYDPREDNLDHMFPVPVC